MITGRHGQPPIACHLTRWCRSARDATGFRSTYVLLVRIAGVLRFGLPAVVLAAVTACGSTEGPPSATGTDAAVPSYEAPADAPGFCAQFASMSELNRLPVSIGTLAAGTDVEARTQVSGVVRELRAVLAGVRAEAGHGDLATALDGLVQALAQVGDGPLTARVRGEVTAALEQVDVQAQPACGFPA